MRSLLFATLCFLTCAAAKAQTQALGTVLGNQKVIPIATNAPGYAIDAQALIYYPDDYFLTKNASKRYPLFLFLHGSGEGASTNISEVLRTSLPQLISQGLKPYGIDPQTGDTIKFIVVSPHCATCYGSYSYPQLQYTIPYLIANYRIDTNCIWAGGLSAGGRGTFSLPMGNKVGDTLLGRKLAGIMPMANGGYDDRTDLFPNLVTAMKGGLAVLYTIGDQDPGYNATGFFQYDALMSKNAQAGKYYPKVIVGGTHSANVWNPPFPETARIFSSSMNSWTQMWALRRTATVTAAAPVAASSASAGASQTITLPTNAVVLSGTATHPAGTTIKGYVWTKVSGGAATISNALVPSTTVTGLAAGVYSFKLTVTISDGTTASATVQVTVNSAVNVVVANPIPGTIQAESYDAMSGIATQATTDNGGGLNVGWISNGDWMDYKVTVAAAGTYTVNVRFASPNSGVSFQIRSSSGAVLATLSPNTTGGWQTWQTASASLILPAGSQTLRVYSVSGNWNYNWIQFVSGTTTTLAGTSAVSGQALSPEAAVSPSSETASIAIYPNPVQSQLTLSCRYGSSGQMLVQVVDVSGVVRRTYNYTKDQALLQVTLDLGGLPTGMYFVRSRIGVYTDVQKIFKL